MALRARAGRVKWFLAGAVLVMTSLNLAAGAPGGITLHAPPPGRVHLEDLWWTDISGPAETTRQGVWLHGAVKREGGIVFQADSPVFDLPPGLTTVRYKDIRNLRNVWSTPGYQAFAERTDGLRPGEHTFVVSLEPGLGSDSIRLESQPLGTPRPVSPTCGDSVFDKYPHFVWTAPNPESDSGLIYSLRLTAILAGQSRYGAIDANPALLDTNGLSATTLTWPSANRALEKGKWYAWRVTAFDHGEELGKSNVRMFLYAPVDSLR